MEPFLSIIVPVYKVERYIRKCILSITGQRGFEKTELIIVDDGSPDNSIALIEDLINNNKNIHLITQQNKGLSAARNIGLKNATGEFVWYVDSDDWVCECIQDLIDRAFNLQTVDMIALKMISLNENGVVIKQDNFRGNDNKTMSGKEFLFNRIGGAPAQRFLYRRSWLLKNDLTFREGILHEDLDFVPRALFFSDYIYLYERPCYMYLVRSTNSITSNLKRKNLEDILYTQKNNIEFAINIKNNVDRKRWLAIHSMEFYRCMSLTAKSRNSKDLQKDLWDLYHQYKGQINKSAKYFLCDKTLPLSSRIVRYLIIRFYPSFYFSKVYSFIFKFRN